MRSQLLLLGLLAGSVVTVSSMIACSSTETHVVDISPEGGAVTVDGSNDAGEPVYDLPSEAFDPNDRVLQAIVGDQVIVSDNVPSGSTNALCGPAHRRRGDPAFCLRSDHGRPRRDARRARALDEPLRERDRHARRVDGRHRPQRPASREVGRRRFFRSTLEDGTRIAFSQDAVTTATAVQSATLAVRDLSSATNLVTLNGAGQTMNLLAAVKSCPPQLEFELAPSKQVLRQPLH